MKHFYGWSKAVIAATASLATLAQASVLSLVHQGECYKLKGNPAPFILALNPGANLKQSIVQCANDADLSGASISGLGAIANPRLHYYDEKRHENVYKTFPGLYELISLNGNIALQNNKRVAHIHVGLGDHQYKMLGGDLESARVGVLAEITFMPLAGALVKTKDSATGFETLSAS